MGKIRGHTSQRREKCVELHKSGNGFKKIATCLEMLISEGFHFLRINLLQLKVGFFLIVSV